MTSRARPPSTPRRLPSARGASRGEPRTVIYEWRATGRAGGLAGAALAVLALVALLGFLVLGALTLTVALWLACAAVLVGVVGTLLGRRGPPRDHDKPRRPGPR